MKWNLVPSAVHEAAPSRKMIQEKHQQYEKQHKKRWRKCSTNWDYCFLGCPCILNPHFFRLGFVTPKAENKARDLTHDATKSGVSASIDNKAVCTLSNQPSSLSRNDLICGIPKTLGCTQDTCTVSSTWSIIPSIKWTCSKHLL